MNEQIKKLAEQCYETGPIGKDGWPEYSKFNEEKFAELIVAKVLDEVLDEVADRAYVSGDRAWSDDADRHWVELKFGFGRLAKMKNERR